MTLGAWQRDDMAGGAGKGRVGVFAHRSATFKRWAGTPTLPH